MNCENCEIELYVNNTIMITDDWYICINCYNEKSIGYCKYSTYCNLTNICDDAC